MEIMPLGLQISMIIIALIFLVVVIYGAVHSKLNIKLASFWLFWSFVILLFGIFPGLAKQLAELMGIKTVSNFVFLLMIGILFCVSFYSYIKISNLMDRIKKLTYEISILKKDNEDHSDNQNKQ